MKTNIGQATLETSADGKNATLRIGSLEYPVPPNYVPELIRKAQQDEHFDPKLACAAMLVQMKVAKDAFYSMAVHIGQHQFVEFAGFMDAFIKLCEQMHGRDVNFVENALVADAIEMAYVAEKFDCIYGQALKNDPKARAAFLGALAELGGWSLNDKEK